MVDSFQFGKIVIDGKEYTSDVMIFPDGRVEKWWRIEGHLVALDDLTALLRDPPNILFIGGGTARMMGCPQNLISYLNDKGIRVIYDGTEGAVKRFNQQDKGIKVAAVFHITC
jgi:hypothetical protein